MGSSCNGLGNPINSGTGNKYQLETDYSGVGFFPLQFERYYNSSPSAAQGRSLGAFWRSNYDRGILKIGGSTSAAYRHDGKIFYFTLSNGVLTPDADISAKLIQLTGAVTGWQFTSDDEVETYNANGKLLSIKSRAGFTQALAYSDGTTGTNGGYILDANGNPTGTVLPAGSMIRVNDASGRTLSFGYDSSSRIVKMTDPNNGVHLYRYGINNTLVSVTYPDSKTKQYLYNEPAFTGGEKLPNALTGIIDENGVRFSTYAYDTTGRAVSSEHGTDMPSGPANKYQFAYTTDASGKPVGTSVTDPLSTARTYNFQTILGVAKSAGQSQPGGAGCVAASSGMSYDANGNIKTRTDFNGNTTTSIYDLTRNLESSRTEASGTALARTITTAWHPTYRLPTLITEPGRTTTNDYDPSSGNLLSKILKDTATGKTRTWAYTYTTAADNTLPNLLKKVDGPRSDATDTTNYAYYPNGDLKSVTDAAGNLTQITTYDGNGRPLTLIDPNTVTTTLAYTPRGRLQTRTIGTETTRYDYDNTGSLQRITHPDGSFVEYGYDDAHRLTTIKDPQGNRIEYTLDPMGNRTKAQIFDAAGAEVYVHGSQFDALSRLEKDIGRYNDPAQAIATYSYDANGNVTSVDGPRTDIADITQYPEYDALDRLKKIIAPDGGVTGYGYNGRDDIVSVTDPKLLTTGYAINGLGDTETTASPDAGATSRTFDDAGNVKTETDARGIVTTYTYDALNRLLTKTSSDAATSKFTYVYDTCTNGKGRLCGTQAGAGGQLSAFFNYDPQGRRSFQLTANRDGLQLTSGYQYTNGKLTSITYPSGRIVVYQYNPTSGKVELVLTSDGISNTALAGLVTYAPFGPVTSFYYGNSQAFYRALDKDYRFGYQQAGPRVKNAAYDLAGNLQYLYDADGTAQIFTYDPVNRLNYASDTQPAGFGSFAFGYDNNGNRTADMVNQTGHELTYFTGTNGLAFYGNGTRTQDAAGNTLSASWVGGMTYDGYGRMASANGATYEYDAFGQRIGKTAGGVKTYFHYGPNGELLYEQEGSIKRHYIYLDNMLIARIDNDQVYYYHTDHLGTPQIMTDQAGTVVWKAVYEPFGKANVTVNTVTNNIRFPGQYYDKETGLHYNYFRDYDPSTGRYVESDPIGLKGGINTYTYVGGNPVSRVDPKGLEWTGNVLPGSGSQDMVCSGVGALLQNNSCVRECCVAHDNCYELYGCNQSSWLGNLLGLASQCQICNAKAAICISHARSNCDGPKCK